MRGERARERGDSRTEVMVRQGRGHWLCWGVLCFAVLLGPTFERLIPGVFLSMEVVTGTGGGVEACVEVREGAY